MRKTNRSYQKDHHECAITYEMDLNFLYERQLVRNDFKIAVQKMACHKRL